MGEERKLLFKLRYNLYAEKVGHAFALSDYIKEKGLVEGRDYSIESVDEQEELFDFHLFKDYVIGLSRVRLGEAIGRFNFNMPGNFQYNASSMIEQGEKLIEEVKEKIKGETQSGWFFMSR